MALEFRDQARYIVQTVKMASEIKMVRRWAPKTARLPPRCAPRWMCSPSNWRR